MFDIRVFSEGVRAMNKNMEKIDHLKKVTLALECSAGIKGASEKQFPLIFIYGIGPEGLTPFEYALAGKGEGDGFFVRVEKQDMLNYYY